MNKPTTMKKILLPLVILFSSFLTCAQQTFQSDVVICDTISQSNPTVWTSCFENNSIRLEYMFTDCDPAAGFDFEGVLIKVTNLTTVKLDVSWHKLLYYAGTCRTCDFPEEYRFEFCIGPDESIEGDCSAQSGYNFKLFSKFIDQQYSKGDKLTQFQLGDIIIAEK